MNEAPPILGYASIRSPLEDLENAILIRLKRPTSWPQILIITITIFVCAACMGLILANPHLGTVGLRGKAGAIIATTAVLLIPAAIILFLVREIHRLRAAGSRPITLAVHKAKFLIDDAATSGAIRTIDSKELKSIAVARIGTSLTMESIHELQLTRGWTNTLRIRFVETEPGEANSIQHRLRALLNKRAPN
jgi:hypothetical protein